MLVFGTRPEAIKMAPLVKAFQDKKDNFETIVCVTGQHREMLDQVLHLFDIKPDFDLNIMKQGQDLYDITSRVLLGMRDVLKFDLLQTGTVVANGEVRVFKSCGEPMEAFMHQQAERFVTTTMQIKFQVAHD